MKLKRKDITGKKVGENMMDCIEEENDLMTVAEMARMLKISRSKSYDLIKQGGFPIIKIGKCIRINKKSLLSWLNSN